MLCPCGSQKELKACCEPFISGQSLPKTPEELMRSRYTAYVQKNVAYLKETTAPEKRSQFKDEDVIALTDTEWLGLRVLKAEGKIVEFMARYKTDGETFDHHEVSKFRQIGEKWYYVDGDFHVHGEGDHHHHHHGHQHHAPIQREEPKVGRNDPCPCGSGKKYKKCHG